MVLENNRKCLFSIYLIVFASKKKVFICFSLDKWKYDIITECYNIFKSSSCSDNSQQLSNEIYMKLPNALDILPLNQNH